jgi:L-rhamnose-H+ transport protein
MRYLGLSLGYAFTLGIIAVFGTLLPPVINGVFGIMLSTTAGKLTLAGIGVAVAGIVATGKAGMLKEKAGTGNNIQEFNLKTGIAVALFAGVMSACFAFGLVAGKPIAAKAVEMGADSLWRQNPVYVVMLLGTLLTNFIWCLFLMMKNNTIKQLFVSPSKESIRNYTFSAIAGTLWFLQFLLYGMGESQMGRFSFAAWSVLMALSIVFSTLWGIYRNEWRGANVIVKKWLIAGLALLISSTIIIGIAGIF